MRILIKTRTKAFADYDLGEFLQIGWNAAINNGIQAAELTKSELFNIAREKLEALYGVIHMPGRHTFFNFKAAQKNGVR